MASVNPVRGTGIELVLNEDESSLLRQLVSEMRALLSSEDEDPVRSRIFPNAYEEPNDELAYREMTHGQLEKEKLDVLDVIDDVLAEDGQTGVHLSEEEAETWLKFLTDARLAIGTRLDVTEDQMSGELDPDDPAGPLMSVLHWLGWVQESTLRALQEEGN